LWTRRLSKIALVSNALEFFFEPVDETLEWVVVLGVEVVASWLNLDVLFDESLIGYVGKDYVLRVVIED